MNKQKLNVKDLITIGILNTIAIACYALAVLISCSTVIGLFFSTAVAFLVMGTVYMLIACKVHKRGTFLLCGALMSLIGIFGGRIFTTVGCLAGGLLAELIVGGYKSFRRMAAAYAGYAAAVAAGIYMPAFLIGSRYLLERGAKRGMTPETVQLYDRYFQPENLLLILLLNAVAALVGAGVGRLILRRHFIKAGMLTEEKTYQVFPWWKARLYGGLISLRVKYQNPEKILGEYIREGMEAADIGSGMGYFTIPMAKLSGVHGKVVAVDLQQEMLDGLYQKAVKEHCGEQIVLQHCTQNSLHLETWREHFEFVLLFAVAHEVPDRKFLLAQIYYAMREKGFLLFAEPSGHVSKECFEESLRFAVEQGFEVIGQPEIRMSRAVLLQKNFK